MQSPQKVKKLCSKFGKNRSKTEVTIIPSTDEREVILYSVPHWTENKFSRWRDQGTVGYLRNSLRNKYFTCYMLPSSHAVYFCEKSGRLNLVAVALSMPIPAGVLQCASWERSIKLTFAYDRRTKPSTNYRRWSSNNVGLLTDRTNTLINRSKIVENRHHWRNALSLLSSVGW